MKLQLDFDNKTITLEADCELKEFIPVIQRILPDWQKWTLKIKILTNWINPVTYPYLDRIGTTYPSYLDCPTITGSDTTGIVNIDTN